MARGRKKTEKTFSPKRQSLDSFDICLNTVVLILKKVPTSLGAVHKLSRLMGGEGGGGQKLPILLSEKTTKS